LRLPLTVLCVNTTISSALVLVTLTPDPFHIRGKNENETYPHFEQHTFNGHLGEVT
jgi:hypothetical protein